MANYRVELNNKATKSLEKIKKGDKSAAAKIAKILKVLERDPYPDGCKQLHGEFKGIWSIHVGRSYRVCYEIHGAKMKVYVLALGSREDVYEALRKAIN